MSFRVANQAAGATPSTLTDLTVTNNLTLSGGTANGVLYLDGSKVATSGSALTFDGTNGLAFGAGGTGNTLALLTLKGGSGATGGSAITGTRNNAGSWFIGDTQTALGSGSGLIYYNYVSGDPWIWYDGGASTERMRLTSTGLGIGTSSPTNRLTVAAPNAKQNVVSTTGTNEVVLFLQNTGGDFYIGRENSAGTYFSAPAYSANLLSGGAYPMLFWTNATERARITSGGYFKASNTGTYIGSTGSYHEMVSDAASNYVAYVRHTATSGTVLGININYSGQAPNDTANEFLVCGDTAANRFLFRSNGGLANYSGNDVNLSDRREKTNFAPAKSYLDTICAIPVQTFEYIDQSPDDPGLTLGVVAQDVQAVAPELVMESNWGTEDNPKMRLSIYQTDLQYALMKCIQELKAQNDELRARVAALESQP